MLFDTFIVRSLLVPALMSMLGELSWWPSLMPDVTLHSLFSPRGRFHSLGARPESVTGTLLEKAFPKTPDKASELL